MLWSHKQAFPTSVCPCICHVRARAWRSRTCTKNTKVVRGTRTLSLVHDAARPMSGGSGEGHTPSAQAATQVESTPIQSVPRRITQGLYQWVAGVEGWAGGAHAPRVGSDTYLASSTLDSACSRFLLAACTVSRDGPGICTEYGCIHCLDRVPSSASSIERVTNVNRIAFAFPTRDKPTRAGGVWRRCRVPRPTSSDWREC